MRQLELIVSVRLAVDLPAGVTPADLCVEFRPDGGVLALRTAAGVPIPGSYLGHETVAFLATDVTDEEER